MSLLNFFYSWLAFDAAKKIFGTKPMQKSKYDGLPWMGGKKRVEPEPDVYDIGLDDDPYDELKDKLEDLESRLDEFDGTDYDFDESLGKVSELMDREHLSENDLDLIERALDNVESRMDDYEDHSTKMTTSWITTTQTTMMMTSKTSLTTPFLMMTYSTNTIIVSAMTMMMIFDLWK